MMQNTIQKSREIKADRARQRRLAEERGGQGGAEGINDPISSGHFSNDENDNENQLELDVEPDEQ